MHFVEHVDPLRIPAPPGPDDLAREFGLTLLTFVEQDALEEAGAGRTASTIDGRTTVQEVSLSYTVWANRADRDDPANREDLSPALRAELDAPPRRPLPAWMLEARERMRHPQMWEAVRTTMVERPGAERRPTAASTLVDHVNHILMNAYRDERVRGGVPGTVQGAAHDGAVERGIPVRVDGVDIDGVRIDTDAHVFGLAADLGERILSAVIPRRFLPGVVAEFRTRPAPDRPDRPTA
ncbi:hypothetical protein [Leifsonia aquatica]|uniref:hypothetical protein n=1 Tax=Leifsonia aquatica TaxID=144185 RepID=UPI00046A14C0|nr:hypothetical protein [Leifsonia aquatica]